MVGTRPPATPKEEGRNSRQRDIYQRIARFYDLVDLPFEHGRYRALRPVLFQGLNGKILDAGVGTGRNLHFYPSGSEVFGIDLSPAMLARAEQRRASSPAVVHLLEMDVTSLSFEDCTFDAVVASFLFCTLPEEFQRPALGELARVLKPGGTLRLLDYRRPRGGVRRFVMRIWEPWARWAFGASFDRRPELSLDASQLELTSVRFVLDDLIALVEATKPAQFQGQRGQVQSCKECH